MASAKPSFAPRRLGGDKSHLLSVPTYVKACGTNKGEFDCAYNNKVTHCLDCKAVVTNSNWKEQCIPVNARVAQQTKVRHERKQHETLFPRSLEASLKVSNEVALAAAGEAALNSEIDVNRKKLLRMVKHANRMREHWCKIATTLDESSNKIKGFLDLVAKDKTSDESTPNSDDEDANTA